MKRDNIDRCRRLRKNQTDAERKLWAILKNRQLSGVKFRRQFSIGKYIEDRGRKRDEIRTEELSQLGVKILRFSDREILTNIEVVCEVIQKYIEDRRVNPPHLNPLPNGERKKKKIFCPPPPFKTSKNGRASLKMVSQVNH